MYAHVLLCLHRYWNKRKVKVKVLCWGPWHSSSCFTVIPCGHEDKGRGAESHYGLMPDNGNVPAAGKVLEGTHITQIHDSNTHTHVHTHTLLRSFRVRQLHLSACHSGWWCWAFISHKATWETETTVWSSIRKHFLPSYFCVRTWNIWIYEYQTFVWTRPWLLLSVGLWSGIHTLLETDTSYDKRLKEWVKSRMRTMSWTWPQYSRHQKKATQISSKNHSGQHPTQCSFLTCMKTLLCFLRPPACFLSLYSFHA